jgi:copper chaperone CopZ
MSQQFKVEGMTCGHCAHAVKEEVGALEGVTSVVVDLAPEGVSTVTVEADTELSADAVRDALIEAGDYRLV